MFRVRQSSWPTTDQGCGKGGWGHTIKVCVICFWRTQGTSALSTTHLMVSCPFWSSGSNTRGEFRVLQVRRVSSKCLSRVWDGDYSCWLGGTEEKSITPMRGHWHSFLANPWFFYSLTKNCPILTQLRTHHFWNSRCVDCWGFFHKGHGRRETEVVLRGAGISDALRLNSLMILPFQEKVFFFRPRFFTLTYPILFSRKEVELLFIISFCVGRVYLFWL